jgi:hypothetical protein
LTRYTPWGLELAYELAGYLRMFILA